MPHLPTNRLTIHLSFLSGWFHFTNRSIRPTGLPPPRDLEHLCRGLPTGSGGILDDPMFANADFTAPGYEMARITIYRSDTIVAGGRVSGTWDQSTSPYILQGDVTVPAGTTLTVAPGVVVYAEEGYGITVHGALEAVGTADQPILFTGTKRSFPANEGWRGIRIESSTMTSYLEHCIVEYGDRNSTYESGGGIACIDSTLEIRRSTLRQNQACHNNSGSYRLRTVWRPANVSTMFRFARSSGRISVLSAVSIAQGMSDGTANLSTSTATAATQRSRVTPGRPSKCRSKLAISLM